MSKADEQGRSVAVKSPLQCTDAELSAFCDLVIQGGEVTADGLLGRVRRARTLAFCYVDGALAGVAALKIPGAHYRGEVFQSAEVKLDPEQFPIELGWVFVLKDYRRRGLSADLVARLLSDVDANVYATSKSGNAAMHHTLRRFGFSGLGEEFPSKENPGEKLAFFARTKVATT
ncbi:MAG: GNAT family N-acetyltransferase [Dongiaceae bacterium]